jgi:hypothetical protein
MGTEIGRGKDKTSYDKIKGVGKNGRGEIMWMSESGLKMRSYQERNKREREQGTEIAEDEPEPEDLQMKRQRSSMIGWEGSDELRSAGSSTGPSGPSPGPSTGPS